MSSFKFIHAADVHLNSRMTPLRARLESTNAGFKTELLTEAPERAFEKLIDFALEEQVDFVVISGDLFDADTRGFDAENFVIDQFRRLIGSEGQKEIPVYLIYGNHDAESKMQDRLTLPSNCRVFSTIKAETMDGPDGLDVKLHGQGFADYECKVSLAENYPEAIADHFNIGLLHTSLGGYKGHDTYSACSDKELKTKGYDYWALGHIHKREEVSSGNPVILFPGNLQGRHVGEPGVKGATLVEVIDGKVVLIHKALDTGRWARVEVDVTGITSEQEVIEKVGSAIAEALEWDDDHEGVEWVAIRVVITGPTPVHAELVKDRFVANLRNAVLEGLTRAGRSLKVWIEDIRIRTRPMISLDEARQRKDPYGEVIRRTESLSDEAIESLGETFAKVKAKALEEGFPPERLEALDPTEPWNLEELRAAVQQEVLTRIQGGESDAS